MSSPPLPFVKDIMLAPTLGTFGILLLYGMTLMQAHQYYNNSGSLDGVLLKALVGLVVILESLHLSFSCHYVCYYLIQHYGEPEYMQRIVWSFFLSGRIGFVVAWLVNMFFTHRVYVLSSRNLLPAVVIGSLATFRPVFGFVGSRFAIPFPEWHAFFQHARWMFITGLSIGLAADFLIAFSCSYYLLKVGGSTKVPSTQNIITVLLWYTINTTIILTLFAVIELIFLAIQPNTLTFFGFFQLQIQLYANCFLTTLNARQHLRQEVVMSVSMPNFRIRKPTHTSTTATGSEVKSGGFINTQQDREGVELKVSAV